VESRGAEEAGAAYRRSLSCTPWPGLRVYGRRSSPRADAASRGPREGKSRGTGAPSPSPPSVGGRGDDQNAAQNVSSSTRVSSRPLSSAGRRYQSSPGWWAKTSAQNESSATNVNSRGSS